MASEYGHDFLSAYYYACGRNDAGSHWFIPPDMFAEEYVGLRRSGGSAPSVRTLYDAHVDVLRRANTEAARAKAPASASAPAEGSK